TAWRGGDVRRGARESCNWVCKECGVDRCDCPRHLVGCRTAHFGRRTHHLFLLKQERRRSTRRGCRLTIWPASACAHVSHSTSSESGPRNVVLGWKRSVCPGTRRRLGSRALSSSSTTRASRRASGAPRQ